MFIFEKNKIMIKNFNVFISFIYIEINNRIVSYSNVYHINIYRYIFTIFLKKISQVVAIASNIEKRYTFLRVLNVRLEILKKNLHSKTF